MKIIFHIDANSAYLSWTANQMLENGSSLDIRDIPSVITGNPKSRQGIILAKSIAAKKYGIKTGESLMEAKRKCPHLKCYAPDYDLYTQNSEALFEILKEYSPEIERYSIDECFLDYSASAKLFGDPVATANLIRKRIREELGFTVNIGVSTNKLLAKMASELKKPDMTHTIFPEEISNKMWPLPVGELFFIGKASKAKLCKIGVDTIGKLANADIAMIMGILGQAHGKMVHNFANGIDVSEVIDRNKIKQKGVGNGTTTAYDMKTEKEAHETILALCEKVGMRLRKLGCYASVVSVALRPSDFDHSHYSRQKKLDTYINTTSEIYRQACIIFSEMWKGESIRKITVHVGSLADNCSQQLSLFDNKDPLLLEGLDKTVDLLRDKYGNTAIMRGTFVNKDLSPIQGGVRDEEYLMMGGKKS